jgi:hypothetical protein
VTVSYSSPLFSSYSSRPSPAAICPRAPSPSGSGAARPPRPPPPPPLSPTLSPPGPGRPLLGALCHRRHRILLSPSLLLLFVPPPPPPPSAPELRLPPAAAPLDRRGLRCCRVRREAASRGARSRRLREGERAGDPQRRQPHHSGGRGSFWSSCVAILKFLIIGVCEVAGYLDWVFVCLFCIDSCAHGSKWLRQEHSHEGKALLIDAFISYSAKKLNIRTRTLLGSTLCGNIACYLCNTSVPVYFCFY